MENQSTFSFAAFLHSRIFILAAAGVFLFLLLGSILLFTVFSPKKAALQPIPKDAKVVADQVQVNFVEGYIPAPKGQNENWDKLYVRLQSMGVTGYKKMFDSDDPTLSGYYVLTLKQGSDVAKVREEIYKLKEISSSEPDYIISTQAVANDTYFSGQWDLQKIGIQDAWDITKGSNSVIVAIVDTGLDYNHTEFQGRQIAQGYDFSTCDGLDAKYQCVVPKSQDNDPMDNNSHGTHVAGTIGAVANNGKGIAGINWNVTLLPVKVMGKTGQGFVSDIAPGIQYAADHGAKIINMSLGGPGTCAANSAYQAAINYARNKGVTVIVAAGNDNVEASTFAPASCSGVIVVGATRPDDQRAYYSNYGSRVAIAAPGGDKTYNTNGTDTCSRANCIFSTVPNNQLNSYQGTSMATPHVVGVAALLLAQNPGMTPDQVKKCLVDSGDPISTDRQIGGKRLNAFKALSGCSSTAPPSKVTPTGTATTAPTPSVSPVAGSFYVQGRLYKDINKNLKQDAGEPPLSNVTLTLSGPVDRPSVTTGASGEYSFTLLAPGSYTMKGLVNGAEVVEYRFPLTQTVASLEFDIPMPESVANASPTGTNLPSTSPGAATGSPTPTPLVLYSCHERTTTRTVNNKVVQLKYLDCTPK